MAPMLAWQQLKTAAAITEGLVCHSVHIILDHMIIGMSVLESTRCYIMYRVIKRHTDLEIKLASIGLCSYITACEAMIARDILTSLRGNRNAVADV